MLTINKLLLDEPKDEVQHINRGGGSKDLVGHDVDKLVVCPMCLDDLDDLFQQFFPVFRDTILGLTFLHLKSIAHRDIKPENILRIAESRYLIADYCVGINLTFDVQQNNEDY